MCTKIIFLAAARPLISWYFFSLKLATFIPGNSLAFHSRITNTLDIDSYIQFRNLISHIFRNSRNLRAARFREITEASQGSIKSIQWARKNGCPWDAWTFTYAFSNVPLTSPTLVV